MSSLSEMSGESLLKGSENWWNGKSASDIVEPGLPFSNDPFAPGFSVFSVRESVPAWKWHVAHAWTPSPPVCMSQKSAFPKRTAADVSLTKADQFDGVGTGTLASGGGVPPSARFTSGNATIAPMTANAVTQATIPLDDLRRRFMKPLLRTCMLGKRWRAGASVDSRNARTHRRCFCSCQECAALMQRGRHG